ncbi:extracellular solute-binding protein [Paenibacillus xerothermodurans]|uniref:ABC transporter substrate-binding protein n=1 Tax=Paenibacillus xerothermodurans TaxID=1977292 RepID=A0A2W1NQ77_PAEXE|nr:extracellular solute-binding protein [Paenibacillus xerothermodurans]PZE21053.1 ABC transporter substrate-binding protein [Paenibacillus xerothermodurans]
MNRARIAVRTFSLAVTAASLTGCVVQHEQLPTIDDQSGSPLLEISIATPQVGDTTKKDNEIELAIEQYTNVKLDIQWIPPAAYEDKKSIMLASKELPKAIKLTQNVTTLSAIESGLLWEIGPLLNEYKNLSAAQAMYYDNIKVDGRLYGLPLYRDVARGGIIYRRDWFDALGLTNPVTLDDWYHLMRVIAESDPDRNGARDTYGLFLDESYNDPASSAAFMTRIAVTQGAPNKWGVENGRIVAEFMTSPYFETMKLLRKLYQQQLINPDFAVVQAADTDAKWNTGKAGVRISNASSAAGSHERLAKNVPSAAVDVMPFIGPAGRMLPAEPGNNGFYVFPKATVSTEAELKQLLAFFDKLLEPEMSTLLTRGMEGRHYTITADGKAELKDLSLFQQEVKPYRDSLPSFEVGGRGLPLQFNSLQGKGWKMVEDNLKHAVPNVALTLTSKVYMQRGVELDALIRDAQTQYIMGKIDDAGWQAAVENWKQAGGAQVLEEFTREYAKRRAGDVGADRFTPQ